MWEASCTEEIQVCNCGKPFAQRKCSSANCKSVFPHCKMAFPRCNRLPKSAIVYFLTAIPYFPAATVHFPAAIPYFPAAIVHFLHAKGFPRLQRRISAAQCPSHNCKSAFPHCNSVFPGRNCAFPSRKGLPPAAKAHFLTAIPYFLAAIVHFPHAKGFPRLQKRISSTQCPSHNCKSAFPHCNSVFPGCNCVFPSRKGLPPATKAHFQLVPSPFTRHTERSVSIRGHSAARGRVIHSIVSAKLLRQTSRDTQTEACQSSKPNFHLQRGTVGSPCSPLPSTRHTER